MTTFEAIGVDVSLAGRRIVDSISLTVATGEWLCIIGPNGAGKSTLLKALAGIVASSGAMTIDGRNLRELKPRARACWIAYVAQEPTMPPGMSALEYVMLGRTAHLPLLARETPRDMEVCQRVLDELALLPLQERNVDTLSGGERQRVAIARALAQASPIVLLDEPTTAQDIGYQQEVLDLINRLRRDGRIAVITTMHDLSIAGQYPDSLLLITHGRAQARGTAREVLTETNLRTTYGAHVQVVDLGHGPVVLPGPPTHT